MTPRPSTEQLLVQVLMRSAQEVLRTLRTQPDGAPKRAQAQKELEFAFAPIWNRIPYLTLDFFRDRVEWKDLVVLVEEEDEGGLARMLSQSGIHQATLVPGVEKEEVRRFLEVLDHKRRLDSYMLKAMVNSCILQEYNHNRHNSLT